MGWQVAIPGVPNKFMRRTMFTVRQNVVSIDGSGLNWMVLDKDDFAWGGYDTQEEAQEAADQFQAEDNAR